MTLPQNAHRKKDHPEKKQGELLLGNFTPEYARLNFFYKTKRIGEIAYDINGNPLPEENDLRPIFIAICEYDANRKRK